MVMGSSSFLMVDVGVVSDLYDRLGVDSTFRPRRFGTPVNASRAGGDPVERELENWLRDVFRESNSRLEEFLGRPLPWPT